MKRLACLSAIAAFLLALPLLHLAHSKPATKVDVCHVNSANDTLDLGDEGVYAFGRVISVSENAVPAHLNHGDSLAFFTFDKDDREAIEDAYDINLPNADCAFLVEP
jgi:hypothetical protein